MAADSTVRPPLPTHPDTPTLPHPSPRVVMMMMMVMVVVVVVVVVVMMLTS